MQLTAFSITNYRSIVGNNRVPISDFAVLIGKNNEGKSNILRALAVSMRALTDHAAGAPVSRPASRRDPERFLWKRDFPMSLQSRKRDTDSIFRLEFTLDADEVDEFREAIKSYLNGTLPIEISIGKDNAPTIKVPKKGPGGTALSAKSSRIAQYIADRIDFNYIPAVRTEEKAEEVVSEMVSRELAKLESQQKYQDALQVIADLQQPVLRRIGNSIKDSLTEFLPGIKSVHVSVPPSARRVAFRNQCEVEIDDGVRTHLEYKGDGVKSLAVLGLLRAKERQSGAASIIAIEEPESHLHPGAIHSLREVIMKLVDDNQVVLTTHCPLFVDRDHVSRNILIDSHTARPAKSVGSIRELLGVRASDNLVNATHVLVVEGMEDEVALRAILPTLSEKIGNALKQHILVIDAVGGSGNLSYKLSTLANALCATHVLLDNDEAGRSAYEKAEADGHLKLADLTLVKCQGMQNSEMEDCFDLVAYAPEVNAEFGVDLTLSPFKGNSKWSERVKNSFDKAGKPWNDKIKARVKNLVAKTVAGKAKKALSVHKRAPLDALVAALEKRLASSSATT